MQLVFTITTTTTTQTATTMMFAVSESLSIETKLFTEIGTSEMHQVEVRMAIIIQMVSAIAIITALLPLSPLPLLFVNTIDCTD